MTVIDAAEDIGNLDQLRKDLNDAVISDNGTATKTEAPTKATKPDWCPAKFWDDEKGEVMAEKLGRSYGTLESSHGRMANDLGQQRQLTDRLLDLKRANDLTSNGGEAPSKPVLPKVQSTELLDNPAETIDRVVEARLKQEREQQQQVAQKTAAEQRFDQFVATHPDYADVAKSDEFRAWVDQSPSRKRLSTFASQGNVDAADDLLTEFKSAKPAAPAQNAEQRGVEAARNAGLEVGNSNAGSKQTGKTYRRVDLLRLKQTDPDTYYSESYQAEILKAYAENRVK